MTLQVKKELNDQHGPYLENKIKMLKHYYLKANSMIGLVISKNLNRLMMLLIVLIEYHQLDGYVFVLEEI